MKQLIVAGSVILLALLVRFVLPLPQTLDIHVHDTYRIVPVRSVVFWVLLALSGAWLVFAGLKSIRSGS